MKRFNVAVVGATGAVGEELFRIMEEFDFPVNELLPLASAKSAGSEIEFKGKSYKVVELTQSVFDEYDIDIAFFSAGGSVSAKFAPFAAASGAVVIDNTSHFRMEADIPLVVPECNPEDIAQWTNKGIIANPNCSTIQMVQILKPLDDANDASDLIKDIDQRLETLRQAPKADKTPVGFLFDSGSETIFTSGKFGAPQTILEAAGAANATADVEDTWTQVGWETVPTSQPDFFVFVEYPGQTYQEKVDLLKSHPATKDLPAVKEEKFINLPYSFWTSGPMNIDAAEFLRKGLESYGLQPESTITTKMELPADFPGQVL